MKYWLLTTEYPPLYGGGISTYCYHTAKMLVEKGQAVTVFIPDDRVKDYTVSTVEGIRLVHFNDSRSNVQDHLGHVARMSYEFAAIVMELIRKEGKPDCIESQEYLAIPYYLLQFKLLLYPELAGIPIFLTVHSPAFLYLAYNREGIYEFPHYWIGEMEKSCIRGVDAILAPSQYIIDEIGKHAIVDKDKVTVLRNPYPVNNELQLNEPIQRGRIVFYGKLSPQKGIFEMFSYFSQLWDQGFTYSLTVIGGMDKVYYPEMKTMGQIIQDKYSAYSQKGLIEFTGKIPPTQRDQYLSNAHVILIPSLNDNLPYAALEAMSIGKVVLASVQGGQAEVIRNGINGFLFDHNIPGSFGEQLKLILGLDDNKLREIGSAAYQEIKESLNYDFIYQQKMKAIEQVIVEKNRTTTNIFPFTRSTYAASPMINGDTIPGLLSIVVPYYNMGEFINETIDSLRLSAYPSKEILIIDDGSTDPVSIDKLKEFEDQPGIAVIHKRNTGLAETRNYGAKLAKEEYLAFLDSDDKVDPQYYAKAIDVLNHYENVFFVGAWVQYFGAGKKVWPTWNPEPPYILLHNSINSSSLVYKKRAFLTGGINDKTADYGIEDYESVVNMLKHGYGGVSLPECLFLYRIRKDSMYRALTKYKILHSYQYISHKHGDFYSKFAPEIFNLQNANGPSFAYDNPSFEVRTGFWNVYKHKIIQHIKATIKKNPALKRSLLKVFNILRSR